jgi:transcriptional regulator of met regulon
MNSEVNLLGSCLSEKSNVFTVLNVRVLFVLTLNPTHHIVNKLRRANNKHLGLTAIVFPFRRDQRLLII